MTAPLYGLLLSGGASRRMARDKAALEYRGEAQLLRAWRLLSGICAQSFVSIRPEQAEDGLRNSLPTLPDRYEAVGPIAGILSAQDAYPDAAWLVLACDLPLLDEKTLHDLVAARAPGIDAIAFRSRFDDLPEPLCAIWEPSSHPFLKERHDAGRFCPRATLKHLRTRLLPPPGNALDNINTPDDFERVSQILERTA
ncbi:NTP transferase domain-containing protein [Acetobacteraceae bacterium KSS8]|uniref:Molybdenum cofactor guanylyltransferase n=1 Tax=Endosaccharibacter trunci TaxID=2812733 RepID=A0ABT1WAZ5_9PROT|nr:NTP transferase domain-containing protein [Acetobacteraceae bacterium KSS8]